MRTWLSSLLQSQPSGSTRLEIKIHRRDTIVYQNQLSPTHSFSIGGSLRNPFAIETPSLPVARFPLVQFRAKQAFVQFTPEMRGNFCVGARRLSLRELVEASLAQPAPYGHRIQLPEEASLHLSFDGLLVEMRWVEVEAAPSFWRPQMPLTPSHPSLLLSV